MTVTPWAHVFIDVPSELALDTEAFWSAVTGWPTGTPWTTHPEFVSMQPPEANPYVHVQRITGAPRVHLDLLTDDIEAEAARLVELGAQRRRLHEWWQVMSSPGGLLFCLVGDSGRVSPGPATWPDGHRSRVVQICIDVPSEAYAAELAFWREATGWRHEPGRRPEYDRLVPPQTSPIRLLIQRLEDDDGGLTTRAHIDMGTDDLDAEVDRLQAQGATLQRRTDRWVVLGDPGGLPFCVTPLPPD
jgi:hypothetical protein